MELNEYLHSEYVPSRLKIGTGTIEQMENAIRQLEKQHGRKIAISEISGKFILKHLQYLRAKNRAAGTIRTRRNYFKSLWTDAFSKGMNTNNPLAEIVPRVPEPKLKPRAWSLLQLDKMLAQAEKVDTHGRHWFGPNCWKALILLIYYTGLRISASLKLKLSDLQDDVLVVPPRIQKDEEEMLITLPPELIQLLKKLPRPSYIRHGRKIEEMLIPWPWSLQGAAAKLTCHIIKPAGLPNSPKLKFHAIRRTVATVVSAVKGKEVASEMLGHSSVKVTERYIADAAMVDPSLPGKVQPMHVLPKLW